MSLKLVVRGFVDDYGYEALFEELELDIEEVIEALWEAGKISDRQMEKFISDE